MENYGNPEIRGHVLRADHSKVCEYYDRCSTLYHPVLLSHVIYSLLRRKRVADAADAAHTLSGNPDIMSSVYVDVMHRGLIASMSGDYETAVKHFESALLVFDDDYLPYVAIADALMGMSKYQDAASYIQKAQDLEPGSFDAWFKGYRVMLKLGKLDIANEFLAKALIIRPNHMDVQLSSGYAPLTA